MTTFTDLPLDVLLYNILTDPDLTPSDVLGLCQQSGFLLLCRLPKAGRAFMNRYYPGIPISPDNPWKQFRQLAKQTKIRYITYIADSDINNIAESGKLFPVTTMYNYQAGRISKKWGKEQEMYVDVYGVPISGVHLIAGTIGEGGENSYDIYQNREDAIRHLWEKQKELLDEHNDTERMMPSDDGEIRYRSPVDYHGTYEEFRQDLIENGHALYYWFETHEHPEYGDFSRQGTTIFSIHENVNFVN